MAVNVGGLIYENCEYLRDLGLKFGPTFPVYMLS